MQGMNGAGHQRRRVRYRGHRVIVLRARRSVPRQANLEQDNVEHDCCKATERTHSRTYQMPATRCARRYMMSKSRPASGSRSRALLERFCPENADKVVPRTEGAQVCTPEVGPRAAMLRTTPPPGGKT
jgi:hypothetical protein